MEFKNISLTCGEGLEKYISIWTPNHGVYLGTVGKNDSQIKEHRVEPEMIEEIEYVKKNFKKVFNINTK